MSFQETFKVYLLTAEHQQPTPELSDNHPLQQRTITVTHSRPSFFLNSIMKPLCLTFQVHNFLFCQRWVLKVPDAKSRTKKSQALFPGPQIQFRNRHRETPSHRSPSSFTHDAKRVLQNRSCKFLCTPLCLARH